jgi:hypothetical protein
VSALATLLTSFHEARAERVFFAPGEVALAFSGGESRPLGRDPWARSLLVEAISELLSQDEIQDLPNSRPRIVRHEHDGVDYVIELARQASGIAVGVRLGRATLRRDPSGDASRESFRESVRHAELGEVRARADSPLAPPPVKPVETRIKPPSKRLRQIRDKRTVRVDVDDEGVPLDATAIDLEVLMPGEAAKTPRRLSKPFRRPSLSNARPTKPALPVAVQDGAPAAERAASEERVYETRIIPRAGRSTTEAEIAGGASGAHVTFLFAPGGYALLDRDGSIVVVGSADHTAIGGELFVAPSMKLRISQGPRESIVTFYRRQAPT